MILPAALACVGAGCAASAVVLWAHRPRHPVAVGAAATAVGVLAAAASSGADADLAWAVLAVVLALVVPALLTCYPAGLPASAGQRSTAGLVLAAGVVLLAALFDSRDGVADAAGWSEFGLLMGVLWWRTETSSGDGRRAMTWLALGLCAPGLVAGQALFFADGGRSRLTDAVVAAVVVACAWAAVACLVVGMVSPRLLDVRRLVSQAARYAVSAELTVALFVGVQEASEAAGWGTVGRSGTTVLALVLAIAFHPVSLVVQRLGDELLLGGRTDPVAVMTSLGAELEAGGAPGRWVGALRVALGVPAVQLWADGVLLAQSVAPSAGEPASSAMPEDDAPLALTAARVPLKVGEDDVGALVVALGADDAEPAPEVRTVLGLMAAPLAHALQSTRLTSELSRQRTQALSALEEERRRLRRDLHDGLGPMLTGIAYSADAARNLVVTDPEAAMALLSALREDTASTITEVRRLVSGLRPPALDERGLADAVRQRVARLRCADGRPLGVEVTTCGPVADLSAAVEVAAYRIAVEAVTNIARHARPAVPGGGAPFAQVRVEAGHEEVVVTITDTAGPPGGEAGDGGGVDGGSPPVGLPWVPGVGLASMRERCEQLHGRFSAGPGPRGGVVRAVLPRAGA